MELKKNIKNALMKRHEVSFLVEDKKNPSFPEMQKQISEEMKKSEELIDVYAIQGKFGRDTFLVKAYVYDSKKDFDSIKILQKTKKQRTAEKEAKKKAEEEIKKAKENPAPASSEGAAEKTDEEAKSE